MMINTLKNLIYAAFSAIWIRTYEADEAQVEIINLASSEGETWEVVIWDCVRGLFQNNKYIDNSNNPMFPLTKLSKSRADDIQIILLHNFHRFLDNPQIMQAFNNAALRGKSTRTFYIVLSSVKCIPAELEKLITVIEHNLPGDSDIRKIWESISDNGETISEEVIYAAKGLTRRQTEDSFSLSIVEHNSILPEVIWNLKKEIINEKGYLNLSMGGPKFSDIGGLDNLKSFAKKILRIENKIPTKGLMLLGSPGVGKSMWAIS